MIAKLNVEAITKTLAHVVNVGRDRGSESPIVVSAAIATLTGRTAPSAKRCMTLNPVATPPAAPRTAYWANRDPLAPATAETSTDVEHIPMQ